MPCNTAKSNKKASKLRATAATLGEFRRFWLILVGRTSYFRPSHLGHE
ncbi:hypothetical protein LINPERHAP1_LOCUS6722 [Linum perenne]